MRVHQHAIARVWSTSQRTPSGGCICNVTTAVADVRMTNRTGNPDQLLGI